MEHYITSTFSGTPPVCCHRTHPTSHPDTCHCCQTIKRKHFAILQRLFLTIKKRLANKLLKQASPSSIFPPTTDIESSYQQLFESPPHDSEHLQKVKTSKPTYYPITTSEIGRQWTLMPNKATDPGYFTVSELKKVLLPDLCAIYNIILLSQTLPQCWKVYHTTLIPKKSQDLHLASYWHPITISSTCVHLLHRILACCLAEATNFNARQKAFIPANGCGEDTLLFDPVIRQSGRQ